MTSDKMPAGLAKAGTDDFGDLLAQLRPAVLDGRPRALRAVDVVQVRTCWIVGRHNAEHERIVSKLAERLTDELVREQRLLETP